MAKEELSAPKMHDQSKENLKEMAYSQEDGIYEVLESIPTWSEKSVFIWLDDGWKAEDVRGQLIKFLEDHWFILIDSNKHEKYRNCELNVTVVIPHQHGYFSERTFWKILKEAGYSKKIFNERKNKKKKGNKGK